MPRTQQTGDGSRLAGLILLALLSLSFLLSLRASAAEALKGVALVIGESAYSEPLAPLYNPKADAHDVEDLLQRLGFETDLVTDETARKLRRTFDRFIEDAEGADVAMVIIPAMGLKPAG